jgi:uncharacterized protein
MGISAGLRTALVVGAFAVALAGAAKAQETGFAAKRPVLGAACQTCPWGVVADVIKAAMAPRGYDVQICYNCSGVPAPRLVAGAQRPPAPRPDQRPAPPPPAGPVDFGVTNLHRLAWAYEGTYDYAAEGPRRNLRAIALIEHPTYLAVAVRKESGITDLAQIRERKLAVRIVADDNPFIAPILAHYGLTHADIEAWGGKFVEVRASLSDGRTPNEPVDVLIHNQAYMANTPEAIVWPDLTHRQDMRFLALPDALLDKLAADLRLERVELPRGYFIGVDTPIRTVARSGQVIYGREDMPEDFAYQLAEALDAEQRRFVWTMLPLSYSSKTVGRPLGVPLHPGAARYYRAKGYLP